MFHRLALRLAIAAYGASGEAWQDRRRWRYDRCCYIGYTNAEGRVVACRGYDWWDAITRFREAKHA